MTWRTGRRVGRTIYLQQGPEPSDDDQLIGMMDTPGFAATAVGRKNTGDAMAELLAELASHERGDFGAWTQGMHDRVAAAIQAWHSSNAT